MEGNEGRMAGWFKTKPTGIKPRVLAVDDEVLNLRLASLMLIKSGFEVEMAENAFKALEMLESRSEEYCLVTLDEVMPKMRGTSPGVAVIHVSQACNVF
jgi:CheY-like chemotaxis protein